MGEHDASTSLFLCEFEDDAFCVSWSDGRWITIFENGKVLVGRSPQSPEHPTQVTSYAELTTPDIPERGVTGEHWSRQSIVARITKAQVGGVKAVEAGQAADDILALLAPCFEPRGPAPHGELEEMRDTLGRVYALLSGDPNTEFGTVPTACVALIERFLSTHPGATTKGGLDHA